MSSGGAMVRARGMILRPTCKFCGVTPVFFRYALKTDMMRQM